MPTVYELQQQNAARRAGIAQQTAAAQQDAALQQYYNMLAQWQYQQQAAQQNADREWMAQQQTRSDKLSAEYQKKIDEANQKNESRYLDILEGRTGTRDRVLNDLKDYGQSQINDATDRYKGLKSQMQADIYSRGFGGSPSMLNSANRSAENARDRELNRINDDIINRRTQADSSLSDSMYGFMERRNDVPPDLNQLIQLQQGLGRSGPYLTPPGGGGSPYGTLPFNPQMPARGGDGTYGPMPFNPGYGGPPVPPQNTYSANSGAFANESLPGAAVAAGGGRAASQVDTSAPYFSDARAKQQQMQQAAWAQRNSQVALKNAMDNTANTSVAGNYGPVNAAQSQAIQAGQANWAPGQAMPLIPGMAGGPMSAGSLLPSLPPTYRGGYGTPRMRQPRYYPNYQRPRMDGYGDDVLRRPRVQPLRPLAASTIYDYPIA